MIHCLLAGTTLRPFIDGICREETQVPAHEIAPGHYEATSGWNDEHGSWLQLQAVDGKSVSYLVAHGRSIGARARWRGQNIALNGVELPAARGTPVLCIGNIDDALFTGRVFVSVRE